MPSRIHIGSNCANLNREEARTIYFPSVAAAAHRLSDVYRLNLEPRSSAFLLLVHVGDIAALARIDQIRVEAPLVWLSILPKEVIVEAVHAAVHAIVEKILELEGIRDPAILDQHLAPYRHGRKIEIWTIPDAAEDDIWSYDD